MNTFSRWLKKLNRSQVGFTLLEFIAVLGISGFLGAGIVSSISQIGNTSDIDSSHVIAVKQAENAVSYIIRDAQMAHSPVAGTNVSFPLTLSWKTWDNCTSIQVIYSVGQNGNLVRQYSENGGQSTSITIAKFISTSTSETCWSYDSAANIMTIKITARVTSGTKQGEEMRSISIMPRSGS
jgi:type II secretory pathway pseudopilin PulG